MANETQADLNAAIVDYVASVDAALARGQAEIVRRGEPDPTFTAEVTALRDAGSRVSAAFQAAEDVEIGEPPLPPDVELPTIPPPVDETPAEPAPADPSVPVDTPLPGTVDPVTGEVVPDPSVPTGDVGSEGGFSTFR